jgi:glyoxylate reductase
MKPYIFITRKLPESIIQVLNDEYEVGMWNEEDVPVPKQVLLQEVKRADALMTMLTDTIDSEVLSAGVNLKVIANFAVGFNNIDIQAATERGIAICNTPDVLNESTADLTFSLLLATARRIVESAEYIKKDLWQGSSPLFFAGHDVHHKTLGIVGMGRIGEAVAKRATGFDMDILYYNRNRKPDAEKRLGVQYSSFIDLIRKSDFIVCLTPLTEETKSLFTSDVFKEMKKTAIFINVSRGPVVDEAALYQALVNEEIAGAGLDVFEIEPIRGNHPLLSLSNVVAIPHIGSSTLETRTTMMNLCIENIKLVLSGEQPKTVVNKDWQTVTNN